MYHLQPIKTEKIFCWLQNYKITTITRIITSKITINNNNNIKFASDVLDLFNILINVFQLYIIIQKINKDYVKY